MSFSADCRSIRIIAIAASATCSAPASHSVENAQGTEETPPNEKNADQCHATRRVAGCSG